MWRNFSHTQQPHIEPACTFICVAFDKEIEGKWELKLWCNSEISLHLFIQEFAKNEVWMIATVGKFFFRVGKWLKMKCACVTWQRSGRRAKCRFIVEAVTIGEPESAAVRRRRPLTQHVIHVCKTKCRARFTLKLNEKKNDFSWTFYI